MPTAIVNGVRLQYLEQGSVGQPLVFLHGFAMSSRAWNEVLTLLPDGFHGYAIDQRGFGESERPGDYSLGQLAEDVHRFAEAAGIGKFTFIGHSMSGLIGLRLALLHPEMLNALVLVAPVPVRGVEMTQEINSIMHSTGMVSRQTGTATMVWSAESVQAFIPKMFAIPPRNERMQEFIDDAMRMDRRAIKDCLGWILSPDVGGQLQDVGVPTLVVAAGRDIIPVDMIRSAALEIKDCRIEVFEEEGHTLFVESPGRFVALLTEFIARANS